MTHIDADVVVLGAGAAGLVTALAARGRRVLVVTPEGEPGADAASELAQGGISAAIGDGDSPTQHLRDTLEAGGGVVEAARRLCRDAPAAISWLEALGVRFDRDGSDWSLHTEAAHSRARVLHVGDATGTAVMAVLKRAVAAACHVEVVTGMQAVSLIRDGNGICSVATLARDGSAAAIHARDIVIATGGIGGLYARSTNPARARGDGLAMALAAGAACRDLEFVQFHPTALDVDLRPLPLLTEALRGAGARLIDDDGRAIMKGLHPRGDLAPRDVVARGVYLAQREGRRVLLDATRLDRNPAVAFPSAHARCREHGFDLRREPVPITPAAHYHMGGIAVDLRGRTSVPGLWAVGEAACSGVHGANRLASNSLLETIVFGRLTGRALTCAPVRSSDRPTDCGSIGAVAGYMHDDDGRELREVMWRCMGVVRNAATIAEGLGFVSRLRERTPAIMQLEHARIGLVQAMLVAAARRTESCGAHFRDDAVRAREATPVR